MTADRADEAQLEGSDTLTRQIAVAGLLAGIASALFAGLSWRQASRATSDENTIAAGRLLYEAKDLMSGGEPGARVIVLGFDPLTEDQARQFEQAHRKIQESLQLAPNYYLAHELNAVYLISQRRYDEAQKEFETAIALDFRQAMPKSELAVVLLKRQQLGELKSVEDRAVKLLEQAVTLDPNDPLIRVNLGYVYQQIGRDEAAQKHIRIAVNLAKARGIVLPIKARDDSKPESAESSTAPSASEPIGNGTAVERHVVVPD